MNHIIKTLILVLSINSYCQGIERHVIGNTGTTLTDGSTVSLDFTVGELAITTITNGTTTLTQGFHQGAVLLGVKVNPTVFLQGALLASADNLMRDDLRGLYLPTTSPYSDALTCNQTVFNTGGTSGIGLPQDNIVDWICVELRDKTNPTLTKLSMSALLQRDGDIVGVDGVSNLEFPIKADDYHVVIKHRNHLAIMSANAISLSNTVTNLDFTDTHNQITYGTNAQSNFGVPVNKIAMWSGNVNGDTQIKYQGSGNDSNTIKDVVINETGNSSNNNLYFFNGYSKADVNLDGTIKYQGSGNDSNIIKDIIVSEPLNSSNSNLYIIQQQIPQ